MKPCLHLLCLLPLLIPVAACDSPAPRRGAYVPPPSSIRSLPEGDPRLMPPGCTPGPGETPDGWFAGVYHNVKPKHDPACREHLPEYAWPHPEVPRPKFPEPPPQDHGFDLAHADAATAEKYFNWLCDKEAGIWNYKYAEVDAIIDLRGRRDFHDYAGWMMQDRYFLDDPLGLVAHGRAHGTQLGNAPDKYSRKNDGWRRWVFGDRGLNIDERALVDPYLRSHSYPTDKPYVRWEIVIPDGAVIEKNQPWWDTPFLSEATPSKTVTYVALSPKRIAQLVREDLAAGKGGQSNYLGVGLKEIEKLRAGEICCTANYVLTSHRSYVDEPLARYGYFSREIQRSPHDRRLGITGSEFVVVDTWTGDILALARMFARPGPKPMEDRYVRWIAPQICPNYQSKHPGGSDRGYSLWVSRMQWSALRLKAKDIETYLREQKERQP